MASTYLQLGPLRELRGALSQMRLSALPVGDDPNACSLFNFPMQANGAEMLRLACIRLVADGVRICAPVHDDILIEAPLAELDDAVAHTQAVMRAASAAVLGVYAGERCQDRALSRALHGRARHGDVEHGNGIDRPRYPKSRRWRDGDLSPDGTLTCPGDGHPYSLIFV
jgi:hypothetical protein